MVGTIDISTFITGVGLAVAAVVGIVGAAKEDVDSAAAAATAAAVGFGALAVQFLTNFSK